MKILSIDIQNFMSISHKYIEFNQNSVYLLNGYNNDVVVDGLPSSNGSGKSSILLAIIHSLYNRNPKLSTLDTVNNIITSTPYTLTLRFEHNDEVYKVVNDRNSLSITVFNETSGKLLARKIKESLVCIEEIIGLSYEEFIALTYIDQTTLSNIFNQRTSLITKFLNLSELTEYESIIKNKRAEVNRELKVLDVRISDIKNRLLNVVNIDEVNAKIESIESKLGDITTNHTYIKNGDNLRQQILDLQEKLMKLFNDKEEILKKKELYSNDICYACGQSLERKIDTTDLDVQLLSIDNQLTELNSEKVSIENKLYEYKDDYELTVKELEQQLAVEKSKVVTYTNIHKASSDDLDKLLLEKLKYEKELTDLKKLLSVVSSGKVTTIYTYNFIDALTDNINKLLNEEFHIHIKIDKGVFTYSLVYDDDIVKDIDLLSGGELTLVSIAVLTGFYITIKEHFRLSMPLLILDEALSRLDPHNIKKVKEMLDIIKQDKIVIVVQHHDELPQDVFDDVITVTKNHGIST